MRAAGRRFSVDSALIWPACAIVVIGSEDSLRLVDAGAVVGLDAPQVGFDDAACRDLLRPNRLLDLFDRGFVNLEARRASRRRLLRARAERNVDQQQNREHVSESPRHARGSLTWLMT